ncbi:MAG TPA: polysaccharide deacetylase family protein [Gaiellaceae bacterium]|nr:polysaccharide deacetylase family protein [Gaiellaceae bacterium]
MIVRSRPDLAAPLLALTFDDGPSEWTEPILALLAAHDARATFFVVGSSVSGREPIVAAARAGGHEIGSHTFSHPHPAALGDEDLREEIRRGALAADARLVRPPYGEDAQRFDRLAGELGLGPTVLWSVDPGDWESDDPGAITRLVVDGAESGAIVDLHDGRREQRATVDALASILPELATRGLRSVTISTLLSA